MRARAERCSSVRGRQHKRNRDTRHADVAGPGCSGVSDGTFWAATIDVSGEEVGAACGILNAGGNVGGLRLPPVCPPSALGCAGLSGFRKSCLPFVRLFCGRVAGLTDVSGLWRAGGSIRVAGGLRHVVGRHWWVGRVDWALAGEGLLRVRGVFRRVRVDRALVANRLLTVAAGLGWIGGLEVTACLRARLRLGL